MLAKASGVLPTLSTQPYPTGNGTNEAPNSVTKGEVGMRMQNRYGKGDKSPDIWPLTGMTGDKL